MPSNGPEKIQFSSINKVLMRVVLIALIVLVGYYGNKAVQSYLGQSAIDNSGLEVLSLEQALQKAQASNKLVLADMSAIWCPTCRKLDEQVFSDPAVKTALEQHFVYARIEYESPQGQDFMQKYKVSGFPTLLVLNQSGEKLVQLPLSFDPLAFIENLNQVVQKTSQ